MLLCEIVTFLFALPNSTAPTMIPAMSSVRSRKATTAPATTAGRFSAPPVVYRMYEHRGMYRIYRRYGIRIDMYIIRIYREA